MTGRVSALDYFDLQRTLLIPMLKHRLRELRSAIPCSTKVLRTPESIDASCRLKKTNKKINKKASSSRLLCS
jgi:hypothetical protein